MMRSATRRTRRHKPGSNEFRLRFTNHKRASCGLMDGEYRVMLRFNLLASVVPLAIAAAFARGEFSSQSRPCIEVAGTTVQIAALSWQAQRHVSFTSDPSRATVRVQISDSAEAADFTVIDDIDNAEAGACSGSAAAELVAISTRPQPQEPVIYLSTQGPADYRIFVQSKSFSVRDAAALIVGARGGQHRVEAASL